MTKQEFETIANVEVNDEQYEHIEALYMSSSLDKYNFVKSIKSFLLSLPKEEKKIAVLNVVDNSGSYITPNGCWYHLVDVEVIKDELSIRTGKRTVKVKIIDNTYRLGYECDGMLKLMEVEVV